MNLELFLNSLLQIIFVAVATNTIFQWVRNKDQSRRDIALVFISLAIAFIAQAAQEILKSQSPLFTIIFFASIVTQPYLLLRVARYFREITAGAEKAALFGLLLTYASLALTQKAPILVLVIFISYFILAEGYVSFILVRGALTIPGITGKRLRFVSLGAGLLALAFFEILVFGLIGLAIPMRSTVRSDLGSLAQIIAILAGLSYYFGFVPPRWLRKSWQLTEVHQYLSQLSANRSAPDPQPVLEQLAGTAIRTVGGIGAVIASWDPSNTCLKMELAGDPPFPANLLQQPPGVFLRVWQAKKAEAIQSRAETDDGLSQWMNQMGARTLLIIPINNPSLQWGLLIIALPYTPLSLHDDLKLLSLIAEQSALQLDYTSKIQNLQNFNQSLEARVAERTAQLEAINQKLKDEIAERELAQKSLQESEERFRLIVEASPNAMIVVDRNGKLTLANQQALGLFGYTNAELLGQMVEMLVPGEFRSRHPDFRRGFMAEPASRPMGAGRDLYGVRKDGEKIPLEIGLSPYRTSEGVFVLATLVDITKRKQAEEKIAYQAYLLDHVNDAIIAMDTEYRVTTWNPAAETLFGWKAEEVLGRTAIEILKTEVPDADLEYLRNQIKETGSWRGEVTQLRKDGAPISIELAAITLANAEGQITGYVTVSRDITERKQNEMEILNLNQELEQRVSQRTAQLEAANQELEAFSYSVSHDLRAPLRSIDGFSLAILEDFGGLLPEQGQDYLRRIRSAAQHMADLIDDLLNLSRVTRSAVEHAPVNLSAIAESIVDELRRGKPDRVADIVITPDVVVNGDARLLKIALENLLVNAWKFTSKREKTLIELGEMKNGKERIFYIRDNGVGFDMTYTNKLFGAFQRLHSAKDFPGTGIGLATVHRIILKHGGRVWAEGAVDQGATFYFTV